MSVGLRKVLGVAEEAQVDPGLIEEFLARNPSLDGDIRERLLSWKGELEFWGKWDGFMITKYGRPYMEGALYQDLKAKTQQLIDPREGDVWLDAGCGQLAMAELIWRKSGGKVKGIWAADIFLAGAMTKLGQFNDGPPIKLIYADLQQPLAFPDNFFDGIIGNHVLTFLLEFEGRRGSEALEGVLQEMFRLLKPGGHFVWSIPRENVSNVTGLLLLLKHIVNPVRWVRYRVPVPVAAYKIFKYTRQIERKGERGTYLLLPKEECERILASVGFVDPEWRTAFAHQCWVNRVYKPDIA